MIKRLLQRRRANPTAVAWLAAWRCPECQTAPVRPVLLEGTQAWLEIFRAMFPTVRFSMLMDQDGKTGTVHSRCVSCDKAWCLAYGLDGGAYGPVALDGAGQTR